MPPSSNRSWCLRGYLWLFRRSVVQSVAEAGLQQAEFVERIFATADAVYVGRVGYAATLPLEAELFHLLLAKEQAEPFFARCLRDARPMLVGYALEGLQYLHSHALDHLPPEVLTSTAMIKVQLGCTGMELTLGELAASVQRRSVSSPS